MKYLTVKEVAENWNVSTRVVQRYCLEGKIEGAKKVSNVWQIPQNASKPINNGRTKQEVIDTSNLMPLLKTPFKPGECLKYINILIILKKEIQGILLYANIIILADKLKKPQKWQNYI